MIKKTRFLPIIFALMMYASPSFSATGYTFYTLTECGSEIKDKYDTYCAAVVSNVFYSNDCKVGYGQCGQWDWGKEVQYYISEHFDFIDAQAIYPTTKKSAKSQRMDAMREWKSDGYKVISYSN